MLHYPPHSLCSDALAYVERDLQTIQEDWKHLKATDLISAAGKGGMNRREWQTVCARGWEVVAEGNTQYCVG